MLSVLALTPAFELLKEILRTFNNLYEDQPPAQRRANALLFWNLVKPMALARLTPEQRLLVEALEKEITNDQ